METPDPAMLEAMLAEARRQNRMLEQATDERVGALEADLAAAQEANLMLDAWAVKELGKAEALARALQEVDVLIAHRLSSHAIIVKALAAYRKGAPK